MDLSQLHGSYNILFCSICPDRWLPAAQLVRELGRVPFNNYLYRGWSHAVHALCMWSLTEFQRIGFSTNSCLGITSPTTVRSSTTCPRNFRVFAWARVPNRLRVGCLPITRKFRNIVGLKNVTCCASVVNFETVGVSIPLKCSVRNINPLTYMLC